MYIDLALFAKAEFLTLKRPVSLRRYAYVVFFTSLYWLMWVLVAFGRTCDHLFFPGFRKQDVRAPVFIVAPSRTGSSLTQKLMSLDTGRFVHNRLYQTILPAITFQRSVDAFCWLDRKLGRVLTRLVHWAEKRWFGGWDEMHKLRFNQPEEDDGFFVYTFLTEAIFLLFLQVDELWEAGFHDALPPRKRRKVMAFYRSCLQRRLYVSGSGKTILAKATQSAGAVESLLEAFPDAKFITIMRDPCKSVASHVSVFWPVWKAHSPSLRKDGPESRAYARLAIEWFRHLFAFRAKVDPRQYYCIDYRDLKRDPQATLEEVYRHFGWTMSSGFRDKLALAGNEEQEFSSNHTYSLEEFGLTKEWIQEELGDLMDYYNLNGKIAHAAAQPSSARIFPVSAEAPPGHVEQTEAYEQKPIGYDGGGYRAPVKASNGHEERQRDVSVARPQGHNSAATPVRAADQPSENNRGLTDQPHGKPRLPAEIHD
jgi:hypothetical protein